MQIDEPYLQANVTLDDVEITELIVHGVGGAQPTELLADLHPERVSGDRHAGFYRPQHLPERDGLAPSQFPREAYAWGGLTSGDASRAMWFLLLPFALMNTSGWMHSKGKKSPAEAAFPRTILRLLAALGTVMAVVMFAHLALDLVAYQCGWQDATCRTTHWWLGWLEFSWFIDHPGRALAVASLVPLVGLGLFWGAGLLSVARFESYVADPAPPPRSNDRYPELSDAGFWQGEAPVRRLRRLHSQLGVATTAAVLAVTTALLDDSGWSTPQVIAVWLSIAAIVLFLVLIAHPDAASSAPVPRYDDGMRHIAWALTWIAMTASIAVASWGAVSLAPAGSAPRLAGLIPIETILTATQATLGVALIAIAIGSRNRNRGAGFFGGGAVASQLLGWFMLISLWAGLGIRLADWFGNGEADASRFWHTQATTCDPNSVCYPIWFEDAAVAFAGVLFVGALLGLIAFLRRPASAEITSVESDFDLGPSDDRARVKKVAWMHRLAGIVTRADRKLAVLLLIGVLAFVVVSIVQVTAQWRFPSLLVTASGWLVAMVPVGAVVIVRAALNNPSTRRLVGSAFDVLTFFPRRVHPFAPPCYGERAVPQLRWRLGWLAEDGRGRRDPRT